MLVRLGREIHPGAAVAAGPASLLSLLEMDCQAMFVRLQKLERPIHNSLEHQTLFLISNTNPKFYNYIKRVVLCTLVCLC